jgi:hypothetical protein
VKLVDRFICRREGHVPMGTISVAPGLEKYITSYITTCRRCGKQYEVVLSPSAGVS